LIANEKFSRLVVFCWAGVVSCFSFLPFFWGGSPMEGQRFNLFWGAVRASRCLLGVAGCLLACLPEAEVGLQPPALMESASPEEAATPLTASGFRVSLSAASTSAPADGASTIAVTAQIQNSFGMPMTGAPVTFSAAGGANILLSPAVVITDCNGRARTSVASIISGTQGVTAQFSATRSSINLNFSCAGYFLAAKIWPYVAGSGGAATLVDLNGDRNLDFLAVMVGSGIAVGLGNGNGTFATSTLYSLLNPLGVASCDLNNDGVPDMVVSNANQVSTYLGRGDGTLFPRGAFNVGLTPYEIACGDLNKDGNQDVVVGHQVSSYIMTLLGNGDGTLQAGTAYPMGSGPLSVAVADVTNDTYVDVVTANYSSNTVAVLVNNGAGSFPTSFTYATGASPRHIALADFDGDSNVDMAITNSGTTTASLFRGTGGGTFSSWGTLASAGSQPYWISAGDLNGDKKIDLLISDNGGAAVNFFAGNGNGTFAAKAVTPVVQQPQAALLGDLNGDGILDVVATNNFSSKVMSNFLNNGLGALTPTPAQNLYTSNSYPWFLSMGQYSGDALPLLATGVGGTVEIRQNLSNGGFGPSIVTSGMGSVQSLLITDLNNDNRADVILGTNSSPNNLYIYPGNGDGTLQAPLTAYTGITFFALAAADFNRDGNLDLVLSSLNSNSISTYMGTGGGSMAAGTSYTVVGSGPSIATGDVNGDGNIDVIMGQYNAGTVSTFLGNGDGNLQAPVTSMSGLPYQAVSLADLNGDGKLDFVTTYYTGMSVALGTNTTTPLTPVTYGTSYAMGGHATGDVNKDGILDITQTGYLNTNLYLYMGNGDGTFRTSNNVPVGINQLGAPLMRDLNGDGRADVLVSYGLYYGGRTTSILLAAPGCKTGSTTYASSANATLTYSGSSIDLLGAAELTPSNADTPTNAFTGSSQTGTLWDTNNLQVRLGNSGGCNAVTTNCSSLDANWTPQYANLLGYWPLNGVGSPAASTTLAGTVGGSLTLTGAAATYQAGQLTNGLNLAANGNAYLVLPAGAPTALPFTFVGWVKWTGGADGQRIVEFGQDANNYVGILPSQGNQLMLVATNSNVLTTAMAPFPLAKGPWQHIAATVSSTGVTAYVNGAAAVSLASPISSAQAVSSVNYFGKSHLAGLPPFNGSLDELAIFNAVLDANQINQIYSRQAAYYSGSFTSRVLGPQGTTPPWTDLAWATGTPVGKGLPANQAGESSTAYPAASGIAPSSGQVLLWHLDEQSAGSVPGGYDFYDDSGQSNHGKLTGGVAPGTPGILGNAASLDGNTGAAASLSSAYNPTAYAMSVWINTQSPYGGRIVGFSSAASGNSASADRHLYLDSNNLPRFGALSPGMVTINGPTALNDGRWHHLVASFSNMYLYVDGTQKASAGANATSAYTGFWRIGGDSLAGWPSQPTSAYLQGRIDEVAIYNRTLSAAEVKALWRRGANRLKFQIRACTSMSCADNPSWKGPDGGSSTYFSELHNAFNPLMGNTNVLASGPDLFFSSFAPSFSLPANAYFQYKMVLESDDALNLCTYNGTAGPCSPEVLSVRAGPFTYPSVGTLTNSTATGTALTSISGITVTYGPSGCPGGISLNLSNNGGASWYWYNGFTWASANGTVAQSNLPGQLTGPVLSAFVPAKGAGTMTYRAFLNSSGSTPCSLASVSIQGTP
jgi:hypothetical protein